MRIYKKTCNSTLMGMSDDELKKRKKEPSPFNPSMFRKVTTYDDELKKCKKRQSPYDHPMFQKVTTYKVWDIFDK